MKKIKGFLLNYSYVNHRAIVSMFMLIMINYINGRVFDVPMLVLRVVDVAFWLCFLLAVYPIIFMFFPTLSMFVRNGFKLPTKETYTNKSDYTLPFIGKWTVGNGGFGNGEFHSGGRFGSERYAYDFAIMEEEAGTVPDDWTLPTKVEDYPSYGKDVIAVADGVVVKVSNNHPDSRTNGMKAFCDTWSHRGNYIVIKHNDSEYSLIAHLMPQSITAKVDDKVKQGQAIAKCGNSGNCVSPHIHFQLQSSASIFRAMSLPIAFSNIKAQDSVAHKAFCEATGRMPAKYGEIIEVVGNKTYIGRGLDVETRGV